MEGAKPISKSVVGGTRPSTSLPSDSGRTTPATTQQSQVTPKKPQKRKAAAPAEGPAGQATGDAGNAEGYWTQDRMDKASPMEKSPSGDGSGGSSSGLPGSGGSTTPPPAIP